MVESLTLEREVGGSIPTSAVFGPRADTFTPRKSTGNTQEAVALSLHD